LEAELGRAEVLNPEVALLLSYALLCKHQNLEALN
jgi:hypothetical protein